VSSFSRVRIKTHQINKTNIVNMSLQISIKSNRSIDSRYSQGSS